MKKNLIITITFILGIIVITGSSKGQSKQKKSKVKNDEVAFSINDDTIVVNRVHRGRAAHSPKMNRKMIIVSPNIAEFPELPHAPEAPFIFEHKDFIFETEGIGAKPQMFVFNNGDKHLSISMSKPKSSELAKIDKDYSEQDQIHMMPDMESNKLNLTYNFNTPGLVQIKLYDSESNLIRTDENKTYDGKKAQVTYDLENLKDGVYFVEFKHESGKVIKKLNINK